MELFDSIFIIVVIIFSAIVHEVMHGVAAEWLGDKTARYMGRITLNPIPHIDPVGSIFLPLVLQLTGSPLLFAWAKPVPYNPYNLRADGLYRRFNEAIVAGAGPLANIGIAVIAAAVMRSGLFPGLNEVFFLIVLANVMLCLFNLLPLPPLDGSKVLEALLPGSLGRGYGAWRNRMEANAFVGLGIALLFILVFGNIMYAIARFIAGV
ncbi:site-2 protease family protein [Candidatus Kaiserbacteria bacterium]|nr:site-2 protease family protein [Candidatus Kaiserbacteria bacterium]